MYRHEGFLPQRGGDRLRRTAPQVAGGGESADLLFLARNCRENDVE